MTWEEALEPNEEEKRHEEIMKEMRRIGDLIEERFPVKAYVSQMEHKRSTEDIEGN